MPRRPWPLARALPFRSHSLPLAGLLAGVALHASVACGGGDDAVPAERAGSVSAADTAAATGGAPEAGLRTPSPEELPEGFRSAVREAEGPVLVVFFAPSWDAASRELVPVLDSLEAAEGGPAVVRVDVDAQPEIIKAYRVPSVPAAAVLEDGIPRSVVTDGLTPDRLRELAGL